MADPLSIVHDALINLAKGSSELVAIVPNIIGWHGSPTDATSDSMAIEELPSLILAPSESLLKDVRDSCKATIVASWMWQLATGDKSPKNILYPTIWALFRTMAGARDLFRSTLTFEGEHFVYDVALVKCSESISAKSISRGWSALFACEVHMHFTRSTIMKTGT